jgi:hypothetical protein
MQMGTMQKMNEIKNVLMIMKTSLIMNSNTSHLKKIIQIREKNVGLWVKEKLLETRGYVSGISKERDYNLKQSDDLHSGKYIVSYFSLELMKALCAYVSCITTMLWAFFQLNEF